MRGFSDLLRSLGEKAELSSSLTFAVENTRIINRTIDKAPFLRMLAGQVYSLFNREIQRFLKSETQNLRCQHFINRSTTGGQGYTYTTSFPLSVHN
jgi:hypothetical protein